MNEQIPRGIEVLVKKAAVDPEFRKLLLTSRSAAAGEIGLILEPTEAAMLNAVPAEQLETIIANTHVDPAIRHVLQGKALTPMLIALGLGALGLGALLFGPFIQHSHGILSDHPIRHPWGPPTTAPEIQTTQPTITEQIDRLVGQLDDKQATDRDAAQRSLVQLGLPVVAPRLKELLQSKTLPPEAERRAGQTVQTFDEIERLIGQLAKHPRTIATAGVLAYDTETEAQEAENRLLEIGPIALPMLKDALASKRFWSLASERVTGIIQTLEQQAKSQPPQSQPNREPSP